MPDWIQFVIDGEELLRTWWTLKEASKVFTPCPDEVRVSTVQLIVKFEFTNVEDTAFRPWKKIYLSVYFFNVGTVRERGRWEAASCGLRLAIWLMSA